MKLLVLPLLVVTAAAMSGCGGFKNITGIKGSGNRRSETRNVSGFKKIKAGGAVKLDISVQKDFSVSVETDDNLLEKIATEVSGDTLVIESRENISPSSATNVKISMPDLVDLDLSGASTGNIAGVKTESLEVEVSGACKLTLDGDVKTLKAVASGASTIDAGALRAGNAKANASGASTVIVNAADDADLDASGASTVYYLGDPKNLKQNSSGASSVKKR